MISRRGTILISMALAALWSVVVLGLGYYFVAVYPPNALIFAGLCLGLPLLALIARLAQRRFFDDDLIDGAAFAPGSPAEIDQRVLSNTVEQIALAICLWPFVSMSLGGGVVAALGVNFLLMRVVFWVGYRWSPPLRGLGFAGTFYPTILATLLATLRYFFVG